MKRLFATLAAILLLVPINAQRASASDWGGYANPASSACGSNYVVKQKAIPGRAGLVGGYLQIKWSRGCPGNYARLETANGHVTESLSMSIHAQASPYNKAGTDEGRVATAWTYVIRLNNSSDAVCAYIDVRWFYQFPWEPRISQWVCA